MVLMVLSLCLLIKYNLASCLTKIPASKEFRVKSLDNCMNFLLHLQIMRVLGPTKHTLNGFVMQLQKLGIEKFQFSSVQSLSHIQLLATSWTAARQASLSTQTHVHWVGDAIQASHPPPSPSPPALSLSQHQSLFQWVSSSQQVAKVLELQLQHQSFQWIFRTNFL